MSPSRLAVRLFVSILFLSPASVAAQEKKPEVVDVTADQLFRNPAKYHDKLVRFEGVVRTTPQARERNPLHPTGEFCYDLRLTDYRFLYITCAGKPSVVHGNRVRIVGKFTYQRDSFVRHSLSVRPPHGEVKKLPARQVEKMDDAALLKFFRERTLADAEREKLTDAIKELGDDDFKVRERAEQRLLEAGRLSHRLLRAVQNDRDLERAKRARRCLSKLEGASDRLRVLDAVRLLAKRKPTGAVRALLDYLPLADGDMQEEVRQALARLALEGGKVHQAVRAAATDKSAPRRAAAAYVLARSGKEDHPLAVKLLRDADVEVRFMAASGLLRAGVKESVPVLIQALIDAPTEVAGEAEDLLVALAGKKPPTVTLGKADPVSRKKANAGWAAWWKSNGDRIDLTGINLAIGPGFVDLSAHTTSQLKDANNKNNLSGLPTGRQKFAGVKFKVGMGFIQLGSANLSGKPTRVEGIKVERTAGKLHFLHATQWGAGDGQVIARYVVHYADKTTADIDIGYGMDVVDWGPVAVKKNPTRGKVAWEGENDSVKAPDKIRLFLTTWKNPQPGKRIVSIDYFTMSPERAAAPFCVAMTTEHR